MKSNENINSQSKSTLVSQKSESIEQSDNKTTMQVCRKNRIVYKRAGEQKNADDL